MLPLDAGQLYDLPEAGRLLFADPARLRRQARLRQVPSTVQDGRIALPRAWVEAEAGRAGADAEALRRFWLERLAPASADARRALRDRGGLPAEDLLPPTEAARRITADRVRLEGLGAEGTLPALLVDGEVRYDARLVDLLAREDEEEGAAEAADRRRAEVLSWARHEYVTGLEQGAPPPPTPTRPVPPQAAAAAPHAWHLPPDLEPRERPPCMEEGRLLEAEGFETVADD